MTSYVVTLSKDRTERSQSCIAGDYCTIWIVSRLLLS